MAPRLPVWACGGPQFKLAYVFSSSLSLPGKRQQSRGRAFHTHWQASTNTGSTFFAHAAFGLDQTHSEKISRSDLPSAFQKEKKKRACGSEAIKLNDV